MKCSNCPFKLYWGMYDDHENPELDCQFFFCDVPEEFESKDHEGCNLKYKEAKKLASLENVALYNGYFEELKKRRKKQ